MTIDQHNHIKKLDLKEQQIKNLIEENKLIFKQLTLVQEELEKNFDKQNNLDQKNNVNDNKYYDSVTHNINEILIENLKLHALTKQQKMALQIEKQNYLPIKLGKILINGVSSIKEFILLPFRLCKIWKIVSMKPSKSILGDNNFQKVIDAYYNGGMQSVEKILNSVSISSKIRADAYTTIARELMPTDIQQAIIFARQAWETDPRSYRLKWLAFRLHEADDVITSEAILDMLPHDIKMNEQEKKRIERIKQESYLKRNQIAQKTINLLKKEIIHVAMEPLQKEIIQLKNVIKNKTDEINSLNKSNEEYKRKIAQINIQLDTIQKSMVLSQNNAEQERLKRIYIQHEKDEQQNEFDNLAYRTSLILKNILTKFEDNTIATSEIIRTIMGFTSIKNKK